jgi:catechol 2,3-dioxygenase-like lactoylglutathione lyase family enzyme
VLKSDPWSWKEYRLRPNIWMAAAPAIASPAGVSIASIRVRSLFVAICCAARWSHIVLCTPQRGQSMKRTWTVIGVSDVPGSFKWYQALFGQPATLPAHDYFGQILDSDGTVLLCLHEWGAHEHPSLMSPDHGTPGNGLLLFFRVDDFDLALQRARSLVNRFEEEPHVNPNTQTKEFSLRDPDGYYVTISALFVA